MATTVRRSDAHLRNAFILSTTILSVGYVATSDAVAQGNEGGPVFFLSDTSGTPRWAAQDEPYFREALSKLAPDIKVELLSAEGDPRTQADQLNNAITLGASAIILVTVDENAAGGMLAAADRAGIPVVLYDHAAKNGPAAARVFFDFEKTGYLQGMVAVEDLSLEDGPQKLGRIQAVRGMSVTEDFAKGQDRALQPLYDSGKVELVCDDWTVNVDPAEAQRLAEQCITRNNNEIDAFITLNDAYIVGMIGAARGAGLNPGDIKMFGGQDADVAGVQNMIRGYQAATTYKPFRRQAEVAARVVASLIQTGELPSDLEYGVENNGYADIPTVNLEPMTVRPDQIGILVDEGVYEWSDICVGDVAGSEICKSNL